MFVDISYSWGDRETPIEIPANKNNWDYMLELAIREMKEECRTHCGEGMASIIPTEDGIELHIFIMTLPQICKFMRMMNL